MSMTYQCPKCGNQTMSWDTRSCSYLCLALDPRCGASCCAEPPGADAQPFINGNTTTATKFNPAIQHVLKFFAYAHLPERLQAISAPFAGLANQIAERSPDSPETTVALRKLLEAKDAAVRAGL